MKKKKELWWIKTIKLVLVILFIVSSVVIALYPVSNSTVNVEIDTKAGKTVRTIDLQEVSDAVDELSIDTDAQKLEDIAEIRFYRVFKSITVDRIAPDRLELFASIKDGLFVFNERGVAKIRQNVKSFLYERLIVVLGLFSVVLFLFIVCGAIGEKMGPENKDNHGPIHETKKFFSELVKYAQYVNYAAKSDLKAEVANSYLNRLWWILEPFFSMLVYVIVFGQVMGQSVENYATFVFSALLMWGFFSKTLNYSVKCVRTNRDIVTKVYVPKHVLLISNMILNFYKLVFSLIVLIPMLFIFRVHIGWEIFWVIPAYLLMIIFSFGLGMIFLHYGVYVDDLSYAVQILLQMLMFLSGMFYEVVTTLPSPLNAILMCGNPAAMFIDTMRNALLYRTIVNVPLIIIWTVIAILLSYIGIHIVYKNENGYVKVV